MTKTRRTRKAKTDPTIERDRIRRDAIERIITEQMELINSQVAHLLVTMVNRIEEAIDAIDVDALLVKPPASPPVAVPTNERPPVAEAATQ